MAQQRAAHLGERTFPGTLSELAAECADNGQRRPIPLILSYGAGDCACLHQDMLSSASSGVIALGTCRFRGRPCGGFPCAARPPADGAGARTAACECPCDDGECTSSIDRHAVPRCVVHVNPACTRPGCPAGRLHTRG
ncbi:2OG-Fe(II) oxygenase [Streptomyces malaysiense]|uniref:2OG-Fe(II) oxygenase n=1 Tax=Streptomyces malaysiense TaxID=1428626 RepID=UPI001F0A3B3A|nr:2OG-Fe(II) oxygenase [Streptomyces malaysiense]